MLAEPRIIIEYEREEKLKAFNRDVCWEMLLSLLNDIDGKAFAIVI
jgi:hypothetical protein